MNPKASDSNKHIFCLTIVWLAAVLFVGVSGEFPLNDDWSYTHNVYDLAVNGKISFSDWPAMTLIGHTFYGALFCKIFGFSFTILRLSTLIAAWLTMISSYFLFCRLSSNSNIAFFTSFLLAFNPIFFCLSFTFMTDVHFLCLSVLSLLFYVRHIQKPKTSDFVMATFFAVWATLIRQVGLILPVIYFVNFIYSHKWSVSSLFKAAVPLFIVAATMLVYSIWRGTYYGFPPQYGSLSRLFSNLLNPVFYYKLTYRPGIVIAFVGLFCLPVFLLQIPFLWRRQTKRNKALSLILTLFLWFLLNDSWHYLPHGNIFYNFGLGPLLLKDSVEKINMPVVLSADGVLILRILFSVGAASLFIFMFLKFLPSKKNIHHHVGLKLGAALTVAGFFFYLMLDFAFFDRYFLFLLPFLSFLFLPDETISYSKIILFPSLIILLILSGFSVLATRDYLEWNRARWKALDYLTAEKNIPHNRIDGGFEFNAWHKTAPKDYDPNRKKVSWWFVDRDDYIIANGLLPDKEVYYSVSYWKWLQMEADSIVVLTVAEPYATDTVFSSLTASDSLNNFLSDIDSVHFGAAEMMDNTTGFNDKSSLMLTPTDKYGLFYKFNDVLPKEKWTVRIWKKGNSEKGRIVLSAPDTDQYYKMGEQVVRDSLDWKLMEMKVSIPSDFQGNEIDFYVWNNSSDSLWFDDIMIIRERFTKLPATQ